MILFTCPAKKHGATTPVITHPCGKAAKALDDAGHRYELHALGGFKNLPLSRRGRRGEVEALTGGPDVPVLKLDDDSVVAGSDAIIAWARANPAAKA